MNPKSRTDLQRKLSLNAVPRPPAGLADRIKADIPNYLEVDTDRARFSRSIAFNMRIAASILLLVTSLAVTVYLVSPETEQVMTAESATPVFAPQKRELPRPVPAATEEVRLEIAQEPALPEIPQIAMSTPPPVAVRARELDAATAERADTDDERKFARENGVEGSVASGVVGGMAGGVAASPVADFVTETAVAPAPSEARDTAAGAAPMRPQVARAEESLTVTAAAPSLSIVREAQAAKMTLQPKNEVFGISVDPAAFQRIRETLENGGRPSSSSVDVEALVNYFAGAAVSSPRRGVRLEVEASPAAIEADGDHAVLRFSIDAAKVAEIPGGSTPPIAADARIEVVFEDKVVRHARRVGGSTSLAPESILLSGMSVTGLYALEMMPNLKATQTVATVRLHYKAVPDGNRQTITRKVRASDLPRNWSGASRRHRLASLGAVWGETLKGAGSGTAVARRAEELATQKPDDNLARDLAAAASASSGGS